MIVKAIDEKMNSTFTSEVFQPTLQSKIRLMKSTANFKKKSSPGVNFIKVGHTAQIIEIGLSICALGPTFEKLFCGVKVGRRVQLGANQLKKSSPGENSVLYSNCYINMSTIELFD